MSSARHRSVTDLRLGAWAAGLLGLGLCACGDDRGERPSEPAVSQEQAAADLAAAEADGEADFRAQDVEFLKRAAMLGAYEVAAAGLALRKALDTNVRAHAHAVLHDHGRLVVALDAIAEAKDVVLPRGPDMEHSKQLADLRKQVVGYDFDEDYANQMRQSHREVVGLYERALRRSRDPDVRDFAGSALKLLRSHRDAVKELQEVRSRVV